MAIDTNPLITGIHGGSTVTAVVASTAELTSALASGSTAGLSGKHVSADSLISVSSALGLPAPKFSTTFSGLGTVVADGQLGHLTAKDGANVSGIYVGTKPSTWTLKMEVSTQALDDGVTYVDGVHNLVLGSRIYIADATTAHPRHTINLPTTLPTAWLPTEIVAENWSVVDLVPPSGYSISYNPWGGAGRALLYRNPNKQEFYLYNFSDSSERAYFSAQGVQIGETVIGPSGSVQGAYNVVATVGNHYAMTIYAGDGTQIGAGFWIENGTLSSIEPDGTLVNDTSVDFFASRTNTSETLVSSLQLVAAETYQGRLLYRLSRAGANIPISDTPINVNVVPGDVVTFTFSPPLVLLTGRNYTATVIKYDGSSVFKARASSTGVAYRKLGLTPARFAEVSLNPLGATSCPTFTTWPTDAQLRAPNGDGRSGFTAFVYVGIDTSNLPGLYLNTNAGRPANVAIVQPGKI